MSLISKFNRGIKLIKVNGCQRGLASMVYKFFNERTKGLGLKNSLNNEILANELHKPINQ